VAVLVGQQIDRQTGHQSLDFLDAGLAGAEEERSHHLAEDFKLLPATLEQTKQVLSPLNPWKTQSRKTSLYTGPKKNDPQGVWPSWMTVEDKKQMDGPTTVSDFISQRRPGDE